MILGLSQLPSRCSLPHTFPPGKSFIDAPALLSSCQRTWTHLHTVSDSWGFTEVLGDPRQLGWGPEEQEWGLWWDAWVFPSSIYAIFIEINAPSGPLEVRGVVSKGLRATGGLCADRRQHDLEYRYATHGFTHLSD